MNDTLRIASHTAWVCILALACSPSENGAPPPSAADYKAADALYEPNLTEFVKNQSVAANWLGQDGSFWYRRDLPDAEEYVRFGPEAGERTPLFDHVSLAEALGEALATHLELDGPDSLDPRPTATDLGLSGVEYDGETTTLTATASISDESISVTCTLEPMACEAGAPEATIPGRLLSPDGRTAVVRRSDNLVVLDPEGGERQLTRDGAPYYSYGALPENSLSAIPNRKTGVVLPPQAIWSPDGRFLVASRLDERSLEPSPFVEWVPQDGSLRPLYHPIRSALPGEAGQVASEMFVFEPASGRQTRVVLPEPYEEGGTLVDWGLANREIFVLARTFGWKKAALLRVSLETGIGVPVIEEDAETRFETNTVLYNAPNLRVFGDGSEVVWYSDRTGWGHLYLYDARTGDLKNAITQGEWAVADVVAIDEERREIYFTGTAREEGRDPYHRHLYKAPLDGGVPILLTAEDADHDFAPQSTLAAGTPDPSRKINLEARVFLDTYSTVSSPPVTVLRSTEDGRLIAVVERADASALFEAGWQAPIRERVLAADGETTLYANYYPPRRDIGSDRHPVIDAVYGGPQVFVTPRNFVEAYSSGNPRYESSLARLGFAVVTVDGRGTPGRSSAFRDAGYPAFTQVGIDDHIAAIKALAERHPEMDIDNVGIYGWSWGGTFSAQAILSRPEFYKVSVTGAGAYDYAALYAGFEPFTGVPTFEDDGHEQSTPQDRPTSWEALDVTAMAENLEGKMMIVYGDLDENVPPTQAFRLIDALTRSDKRYDLMYLANRTHAGGYDPFTVHRTWDYFVEHLMGATPPDVDWGPETEEESNDG